MATDPNIDYPLVQEYDMVAMGNPISFKYVHIALGVGAKCLLFVGGFDGSMLLVQGKQEENLPCSKQASTFIITTCGEGRQLHMHRAGGRSQEDTAESSKVPLMHEKQLQD